jgi:HAD superfamily hydrolase (TIGR01549 family)
LTKVIFFDFWGTLVENGVLPSPIKEAQRILWLKNMQFTEFVVRFETVFMTKKYESLKDAFADVCKEFQITPNDHHVEQLIGLWNKNRLLARPFPEALDVISELKKKYKLVLISNTDCFSIEAVLEKYNMRQYFDVVLLSYAEGKLKSDVTLFEKALQELGIEAKDALMVGDSIDSDMKGAEAAGIRGVLLDRKNRREFSPKITNLYELAENIEVP